jgi:hypothetical protein
MERVSNATHTSEKENNMRTIVERTNTGRLIIETYAKTQDGNYDMSDDVCELIIDMLHALYEHDDNLDALADVLRVAWHHFEADRNEP